MTTPPRLPAIAPIAPVDRPDVLVGVEVTGVDMMTVVYVASNEVEGDAVVGLPELDADTIVELSEVGAGAFVPMLVSGLFCGGGVTVGPVVDDSVVGERTPDNARS
jgi:hypothetical protein